MLTGDIHSSWCNDLTLNPWDPAHYNPATGVGVLGAEFVAPAVSSPGPIPDPATATVIAGQLRVGIAAHEVHRSVIAAATACSTSTHERAQCEIYHVATVDSPSADQELAAVFVSEAGDNVVKPGAALDPGTTISDPAPAVSL